MEPKQLALRWRDILPSVLIPFQVGYHNSQTTASHYNQDGYISALMTFLVFMSYGIAASFGNILSNDHVKPIRVYTVEISLSLYLTLGIVVLLMLNCSENVRKRVSSRKPRKEKQEMVKKKKKDSPRNSPTKVITRENVLKYLPVIGMVVFLFGVWVVDILRMISYGECMDEYRTRDSRELYNEGGAAIVFHLARAAFALLIVLFAIKYQRSEVYFYRSLRTRFIFIILMAGLFWMWLDSQLHHSSEVFQDSAPSTSYDSNRHNYTCTEESKQNVNRTHHEECFCKDTVLFQTLKDGGKYLYPINVEFCLLAIEYILYFYFSAKREPVEYKDDVEKQEDKNVRSKYIAKSGVETTMVVNGGPDHTVLELKHVSTEPENFQRPPMQHNPSCGSFQFEDYAMMCIGPGSENCEACMHKHASLKASMNFNRQHDRRTSQQDTIGSVTNSTHGSVTFEMNSTRGSVQNLAAGSHRGSVQTDAGSTPVLAQCVENTCVSISEAAETILASERDHVDRKTTGPILMSYNPQANAIPTLRLPSLVPTMEHSVEEERTDTQSTADVDDQTKSENAESTAKISDQEFEADTETVVNSIHFTEGESQEKDEKKQSIMVSVKEKLFGQWLLLTISCSVALLYFIFSIVISSRINDNTVSGATITYLVYKILYWILTSIIIWLGFHYCRSLQSSQRGYNSFEMAILICSAGILVNRFLSLFTSVSILKMSHDDYHEYADVTTGELDAHKKAGFVVASCIFNILEVYLQTVFMFHCVSIKPPKTTDIGYKNFLRFKQVLLYLISMNMTFWLVDSFTVLNPDTLHSVQLSYFSEDNYELITHLVFPFALFYRFNSCLYFLRIFLNLTPPNVTK